MSHLIYESIGEWSWMFKYNPRHDVWIAYSKGEYGWDEHKEFRGNHSLETAKEYAKDFVLKVQLLEEQKIEDRIRKERGLR